MWLVLSGVLAATPITVAVTPFQAVNVSEKEANFAIEHLAERMGAKGVRVITPNAIANMLGRERQRQLFGCADDGTSCMAELADALGAELSMLGSLAKLGNTLELSVRVIVSHTGERRASFSGRVTSEAALFALMDEAGDALVEQLQPRAPSPGPHLRPYVAVPAIVAGLAAVGAGVGVGFAVDAHDQLTNPARPAPGARGEAIARTGETMQVVAVASGGVAVAAAAVAVWFYASGAPPPVVPSVGVVGGAATLTLGGTFP